jgi:hypothetical protein
MQQEIEFPFAAGVREDVAKRILPIGQLSRARNVYYAQDGRLQKRNGFAALTMAELDTTAFDPAPIRLPRRRDEDIVIGQTRLATYIPSEDAFVVQSDWVNQCSHVRERTIARRSGLKLCDPVVACNAGYTLHAWLDTAHDVHYALIEDATGGVVQQTKIAATARHLRAWQAGEKLFFGFIDTVASPDTLEVYAFTLTTPGTAPSNTQLSAAINETVPCWDVADMGYDAGTDSDWMLFAFHNSSGHVVLDVRDDALNQQSTVDWAVTLTTAALACWGRADERLYVAWHNDSVGLIGRSYADDCTDSSGDITLDATTSDVTPFAWGRASATQAYIYFSGTYDVAGSGTINRFCTERKTLAGGSGSITGGIYRDDAKVASKPFSASVDDGDEHYIWLMVNMTAGTSLQKQYILVRYDSYQPLARVAFRTAFADFTWNQPGAVAIRGTDRWTWSAAVTYSGELDIASPETGVDAFEFDFAARDRLLTQEAHDLLCMTGGVPYYYDGLHVAELGFLLAPDTIDLDTTAGALTGTYSWCVVFETFDDEGNRHQSAPSAIVTDTLASEDGLITIPYLSLTQRSNVRIKLYRTKAGGTLFYEVAAAGFANDPNSSGGIAGTSGGIEVQDGLADSSLGKLLYTTGGEVETFAPPSASCICSHAERVWLGCGPRAYYSHQRVPGEAPTFSETFYVQLPEDVTALASLDSALAIFTESAIFLVYGDGPDRTGQNAYEKPQRLTGEAGAIDGRLAINIPGGVVFRSERGIELQPRGAGPLQYIGGPVQETLADYPDITGAVVDHELSHLYISCVDEESSPPTDGAILVYNYRWDRWSTWDTSVLYFDCLGLWSGGLTIGRADGTGNLWQQDSSFADPGPTWVQFDIETGDLRPAGIMKYQRLERINVLGEYRGTHKLNMKITYDGNRLYTDLIRWEDVTSTAGDPKRWECSPSYHKVESVRVQIYDSEDDSESGKTEGVALHALSISVKPKRGPSKLALAQRG